MAIDYNKYISRLKARREKDPQYEATRLNTFRAIEPARAMTRQVAGNATKQGASVGAQAQLLQDSNQQMSNILGTVPSAPDTSQIDNQIMTLEMQRDQEKQTGKDNPMYGTKKSPEWIEMIKKVNRERIRTPEERKKLSESLKGKPSKLKGVQRTKEAKLNISLGHKRRLNEKTCNSNSGI